MMRHEWYGNDRDLVKWSVVVHLARRDDVRTILHVAMRRPDAPPHPLSTSRGRVDLPEAVRAHFRDLDDIQRLAVATGLTIEAVSAPFRDRRRYFDRIVTRIRQEERMPMLVLLDPDVGLVSEQPGPEHVASSEVAGLFEALQPGDLLVCYQHGRKQKDWRGRARRAFANAPGLPSFDVEAFESEQARDVLLLAVRKPARRDA